MYRSAAIIVVCLAIVTIIGSFSRTDTNKFQKDIELLREELRPLKELSHDVVNLEQEVANLQKEISSLSVGESSAISKASYRLSKSFQDDPFLGKKQASILVMMFGDYQCKACKSFWKDSLPQIKQKFIETNRAFFSFRDFALKSHPHALQAGNLAHCAGEQGAYWDAFNLLYEKMDLVTSGDFGSLTSQLPNLELSKLERCIQTARYNDEMLNDRKEGEIIGAKGIPGFFIGKRGKDSQYEGVFVRGAQPTEIIVKEIEKLL